MKKPDKSPDFSKIKISNMTLNHNKKNLEIEGYRSSKFISSLNQLLQGEYGNSQDKKRNALLTAINLETGKLIGKGSYFKA